jgi:NAD(P)-dependent dehydrogenase (short-subunit alcohol dehydrogenase family)
VHGDRRPGDLGRGPGHQGHPEPGRDQLPHPGQARRLEPDARGEPGRGGSPVEQGAQAAVRRQAGERLVADVGQVPPDRVPRLGDQYQLLDGEHGGGEARGQRSGERADGEVDAVRVQVGQQRRPSPRPQLDVHTGVAQVERAQGGGRHRGGLDRPDPHPARDGGGDLVGVDAERGQLVEDAAGSRQDQLPGAGELDAPRRAVQQQHPQLPLQGLHPRRHRRLGQVQVLGGAGEPAEPGHGLERDQPAQLHGFIVTRDGSHPQPFVDLWIGAAQGQGVAARVWLVTGAASGFGREIVRAALDRGDGVVVAVRDPAAVADLAVRPGALVVRLDVTDPVAVAAAVAAAHERFGRIDVLVNNAGRGLVGALEETTPEQVRALVEINVFGVLAMTRAVLPGMRERGGGHLVQLSSVGGVVANPGHACYAMTKFALEGVSEGLAAELAPFGIRVTIVEPGPFRTASAGRSMVRSTPLAAYAGTPAADLRAALAEQDGRQPGDPARAAAAVLRCVDDPGAPLRLPLGDRAVDRIRAKLTAQLADLDAWEDVARATGCA